MFTSLMYVSKSRLTRSEQAREIEDIVCVSSIRNEALQIRGALAFTGRHFAQILEGPKAGVDSVMDSICRDHRHDHVTIVCEADIEDYRFASWTLAYQGSASYMDQHVAALLRGSGADHDDDAARLYFLIRNFALENSRGRPLGRPSRL